MGGVRVSESWVDSLVSYTRELSELRNESGADSVGVHNVLQMLASTVDYQFA